MCVSGIIFKNMDGTQEKENRHLYWTIIGIMVAFFIAIIIVRNCWICAPKFFEILFDTIIAILPSGIVGFTVAILVDTPQIVRNFKKTLTDALASKDYLQELPPQQLEVLRKQIVHLVHKNSERVPASFLELDDNLCDLIDAPYYDYLNECFVIGSKKRYCDILNEDGIKSEGLAEVKGEFFKKDVRIEFVIKNPCLNTTTEAVIGLSKYLDLPEECETNHSYVIKGFDVTIDGGETFDIRNSLVVERCKVTNGKVGSDPNTMTYDTIVRMGVKGVDLLTEETIKKLDSSGSIDYKTFDSDTKHEVIAKFRESVHVRISYSQISPIADSHYTRRLKYSAKNYMISYSCSDSYLLHGQILGTLIKQSDMSIIKNNRNNLTMICRNWLLPKNGAFIVMDDIVDEQEHE